MNSIIIDLQEKDGHFAARAVWGMSTWHRDPISAISELFGKAIPFANKPLSNVGSYPQSLADDRPIGRATDGFK